MTHRQSHLLVVLATVLVSGSFLASAEVSGLLHPISLTLLRFFIAMLGLLPFVIRRSKREQIRTVLPGGMIIGLLYSVYFICFFEALKFTTPLNTSTLFTLVPFLTAVFSIPFFKQKTNGAQMLAYLLGAVGTIWVIFGGDIGLLLSFSLNKGDGIFMLSVLAMVLYGVSMKLLYRGDDMNVMVFCTMLSGCFWMSLASALFKIPLGWTSLKGCALLYMAYLAIVATLGTSYIHQKTTVILGPARVMAYVYLFPAGVAILTFFLKGTAMEPALLPGIALSALSTITLQVLIGRAAIASRRREEG